MAQKRCNSNGRISQSEICGGELRATLLRLGGHPPQVATSPPPNGGNCTIRGATRRRHAEGRLLMVQNPHRQRCSERRWARARPRCPRGKRGERQISFARNLTRSFFEMAHKRCNSNDCASKSEICGGELRATLVTGGHDWSVHSHMADQTRNPPRTRRQGGPKRGHSKQQGARGAAAPRAPCCLLCPRFGPPCLLVRGGLRVWSAMWLCTDQSCPPVTNVARNSPPHISDFEAQSLELQRLWAISKNDRVKLRAKLIWRSPRFPRGHRGLARAHRRSLHRWRWGFCTIRSLPSACRRRVAPLMVQFPPFGGGEVAT